MSTRLLFLLSLSVFLCACYRENFPAKNFPAEDLKDLVNACLKAKGQVWIGFEGSRVSCDYVPDNDE